MINFEDLKYIQENDLNPNLLEKVIMHLQKVNLDYNQILLRMSRNIKNIPKKDDSGIQNAIDELHNVFKGNVKIVPTEIRLGGENAFESPFVMPSKNLLSDNEIRDLFNIENPIDAIKTITSAIIDNIKTIFINVNVVENNGIFHISSNKEVVIYFPKRLLQYYSDGNISFEEMKAFTLHEIGHWSNNGIFYFFITGILQFTMYFLIFYGSIRKVFLDSNEFKIQKKYFEKKKQLQANNNTVFNKIKYKLNEFNSVDSRNIRYTIMIIIGVVLFLTQLFWIRFVTSFGEVASDSFAQKLGYGQELADGLKSLFEFNNASMNGAKAKDVLTLKDALEGFKSRILTGYPSLTQRLSYLSDNMNLMNINDPDLLIESYNSIETLVEENIMNIDLSKLNFEIKRFILSISSIILKLK